MKTINLKKTDFRLFIASLIITTLSIAVLRSFSFSNTFIIFIKDSMGNIGGVLTVAFFFIWYIEYSAKMPGTFKNRLFVAFTVTIGLSIYELLQIVLPWMTFDMRDIYGTMIGFALAIAVNAIVYFKLALQKKKQIDL